MSDPVDLGQWQDQLRWGEGGLLPVIAQDEHSGKVLTLAWMNRESLMETVRLGRAVYWSRSRNRLWQKGEQSGHVQEVNEIRLDCDADAILLKVRQIGGIACHTGRESCFFRRLENGRWIVADGVIKDPKLIYGKT